MRRSQDDHDEGDDDEASYRHDDVSAGRVYVHTHCGGQTRVSGGDFTHICDPFWPCTSTYCCRCAGFAPLSDVRWTDTDEPVSEYRRRLRAETPALLKAWRYGVGFLIGAAVGSAIGLLVWLIAKAPQEKVVGFALVGGLVGALVCYVLGIFILNRVFDIDYRRMR